jgi:hypothetical protein
MSILAKFFPLLAKLFPLRIRPYSVAELWRGFLKRDGALRLMFAILVPLCVYALHQGFESYASLVARDLGDSIHTVLPNSNFWYVPALVLGIIQAFILAYFLNHLLLGGRAHEFRIHSDLNVGIDAIRIYLAFAMLVGGMFSAVAFFAAHTSLQLTENEVVIHRLFSLEEERYPYARVKALKEVSDTSGEKTDFVIELDGAPDWTTAVEVVFPDRPEKAYLSQRSGKPIERLVKD